MTCVECGIEAGIPPVCPVCDRSNNGRASAAFAAPTGCAPSINQQIIAFSFGQTSAYMLRKLMDENAKDFDDQFTVIFENTGKEHDATLDFGHEIETRWACL